MNTEQRGRILLVDDESDVSSGIQELLEKQYTYYVRSASTAKDAMLELVRDQFDVVVLDWILRAGDGREVIRFVREHSPETAVIVFSGLPSSNPESTFANADEFVEKSHDSLPLRYAVERGIHLASERRKMALLATGVQYDDWFAKALIDEIGDAACRSDQHLMVAGQPETLCRELAFGAAQNGGTYSRCVRELDAKEFADADESEVKQRFFGLCSTSGAMPNVQRGLLESPFPFTVVVRHAHVMTEVFQQTLVNTIRRRSFCRVGSDRHLQVNCRLVLIAPVAEPRRALNLLDHSIVDLIGGSVLEIPRIPLSAGTALRKLVELRLGRSINISPTVELLFKKKSSLAQWGILRRAVETAATSMSGDKHQTMEIEDTGTALFETLLYENDGASRQLSQWDKIVPSLEFVYLCCALREADGNIAEASRISGIHRNTIRQRLVEFEVDKKAFRRTRSGQLPIDNDD